MTALVPHAPRFETERLILRGPEMPDAESFIAFSADEARSKGFGYIPQRDQRVFAVFGTLKDGRNLSLVGLFMRALRAKELPMKRPWPRALGLTQS